jgi:hypothetical protein
MVSWQKSGYPGMLAGARERKRPIFEKWTPNGQVGLGER